MDVKDQLNQWTSHYINPTATKMDIIKAMSRYRGLTPLFDTYIFNDGRQLKLVNLTGTIPVWYKGNSYNIPIVIWLMDTHPNNSPICYVKPTSDMAIKVSMFVDNNGKIYLPYLHDWVPNDSDLLGLIQVMIVTFGSQPPVFAKPKGNDLPYPSNSYMPQTSTSGFPAYPTPYPPMGGGYMPFNSMVMQDQNPAAQLPYPVPTPSGMPYGQMPDDNTGTIKNEHIRISLLSALEEKLMRHMKEQFQQNQAELETLRRTHMELKQGKAKLDAILERVNKEKNDLDKNIMVLKDKEQELDKAIERLGNQESIDVDDAVTTTAPLYKQLLNAFAEEAALEDAIYYMGEALRCNVIDLDVFLKQVRTLSRKQFMLRALMQKCRQKAGLAPV